MLIVQISIIARNLIDLMIRIRIRIKDVGTAVRTIASERHSTLVSPNEAGISSVGHVVAIITQRDAQPIQVIGTHTAKMETMAGDKICSL